VSRVLIGRRKGTTILIVSSRFDTWIRHSHDVSFNPHYVKFLIIIHYLFYRLLFQYQCTVCHNVHAISIFSLARNSISMHDFNRLQSRRKRKQDRQIGSEVSNESEISTKCFNSRWAGRYSLIVLIFVLIVSLIVFHKFSRIKVFRSSV